MSLKNKKIVRWVLSLLIIISAVFGIVKLNWSSLSTSMPVDTTVETDWVKGNQSPNVVLIEYSDFQCPACKTYYSTVRQLMEELGDKIQLVYRHFPLRNIHKNAQMAGQAAEAAGKQNKLFRQPGSIEGIYSC